MQTEDLPRCMAGTFESPIIVGNIEIHVAPVPHGGFNLGRDCTIKVNGEPLDLRTTRFSLTCDGRDEPLKLIIEAIP